MSKFFKQYISLNKKVLKRLIYIYLPIIAVIYVTLSIAGYTNQKPQNDFLDVSQSYKQNIPIVYNDYYNIEFWGAEDFHPFDSKKYGRIYKSLKDSPDFDTDKFITASKPDNDLLNLAHDKNYLESLNSSWTLAKITELNFLRFFPDNLSQNTILEPMLYQMGGSLMASYASLEHGWAINLGGGFHHASHNNGEGFCPLADISLIIKQLRRDGKINKAMIIDLDAHQGNGHGADFINDENTYILDAYNKEIYPNDPHAKQGINLKIELPSFAGDKYFLPKIEQALKQASEEFKPDIIIYVAGTDILDGDPLGALGISAQGIIKRDELVFKHAKEKNIPIVMLLGGGYQKSNANIIAKSITNLHRLVKVRTY